MARPARWVTQINYYDWMSRLKRSLLKLLLVYAPPILLVTAILIQPWFEALLVFPDPIVAAQIAGRCCNTYFGFISNVGVVFWLIAATACSSAALVLAAASAPSRETAFLAAAAALTFVLAIDDLFMLHERLLPELGVPQPPILIAYVLAGIAYVVVFYREIMKRDVEIFAVGLLSLAVSLGIDFFIHERTLAIDLAEDISKFFGIAGWAGFHILRAIHAMRSVAATANLSRD